jgi:hypothetical protein
VPPTAEGEPYRRSVLRAVQLFLRFAPNCRG